MLPEEFAPIDVEPVTEFLEQVTRSFFCMGSGLILILPVSLSLILSLSFSQERRGEQVKKDQERRRLAADEAVRLENERMERERQERERQNARYIVMHCATLYTLVECITIDDDNGIQ